MVVLFNWLFVAFTFISLGYAIHNGTAGGYVFWVIGVILCSQILNFILALICDIRKIEYWRDDNETK